MAQGTTFRETRLHCRMPAAGPQRGMNAPTHGTGVRWRALVARRAGGCQRWRVVRHVQVGDASFRVPNGALRRDRCGRATTPILGPVKLGPSAARKGPSLENTVSFC